LRQTIDFDDVVWTSTKSGEGIKGLLSIINQRFSYPNLAKISLPEGPEGERALSKLYDIGEVRTVSREGTIEALVALRDRDLKRVEGWVESAAGLLEIVAA